MPWRHELALGPHHSHPNRTICTLGALPVSTASIGMFQDLADALPDMVWTAGPDGRLNWLNKKWFGYTALSTVQSLGHGWRDALHATDSALFLQHFEQALLNAETFKAECRLRRADGTYRWMLCRAEQQRHGDGAALQWIGSFADIDELKQAQHLQDQKVSMLRVAGRLAHLGAWTIDLPQRTLSWSDENCAIHDVPAGYKPTLDEGIGFFLPQDRAMVTALVQACAQHGTPYEFVLPKRTAKGREIWVHSIGEAVRDESGVIVRLQGAFQDITKRRAEQAQLRLLELAVSRLNDMVIIMEGVAIDENGPPIVFVNDAFTRTTGYSRDEVLGRTPAFVGRLQSDPAELKRIYGAMRSAQPVRGELAIRTKTGQTIWLEIDVAPMLDEAGEVTNWVAVERDITERRQQQNEILALNGALEQRVLERTAQLAFANNELESFAYSVSHDLRSPLNTLAAFSQLLLQTESAHLSEKGQHYLERIGVSVRYMGDLIEGLLTLAHLSRGPLKSEPLDMSALFSRVEQEMRPWQPDDRAVVQIQPGMQAQGDDRLMASVVQNLLGNAWKFSTAQAAPLIEVGCEASADQEVVFFVRDNGCGFDMAYAGKLFGIFEKLHSPGEFPGTGIGLATVKRVVERHGGRVWAEGRLQAGATFYFTLNPLAEPVPINSAKLA